MINNDFEFAYRGLLNSFLYDSEDLTERKDRTGVGCLSSWGRDLSWDLGSGKFPLLTGRKIFKKVYMTEFKWFMSGSTNIKTMQDAGVSIWNAWCDKEGELGTGTYGDSMVNWNNEGLNQFKELVEGIKNNPDSRRHKIQLWNPKYTKTMALPTCWNSFDFFITDDNKINMTVAMRSCDVFLGLPYDCALFSVFLINLCRVTDYEPGRVKVNFNDLHVYNNHFHAVRRYMREPVQNAPRFEYNYIGMDFLKIYDYNIKSMKNISAPVAI